MEVMKLRRDVFEIRKRFKFDKDLSASKFGMKVAKELSEKLEIIERRLGVAEYQLQVPGGVLNERFHQDVDDALSLIDSGFKRSQPQTIEEARGVLAAVELVSETDTEMVLLVMEKEMNTHLQTIVRMLMSSDDADKNWSVVPIGKPGTGKTTLTQHVYHDRGVCKHFAVRHLVCLSDTHVGGPSKLLDQVFKHKTNDADILQKFHSLVDGQRYLLILDGVANLDQVEHLNDLLCNVDKGSKVIITAYSESSISIKNSCFHDLESPSMDEYRDLLQSPNGDDENKLKLVWEEYCSKYAGNPQLLNNLAILLRTLEDWEDICSSRFQNVTYPSEGMLSKIDLRSFEELPLKIKQCVVYCSLLPVSHGYKFSKEDLVHLWDAQEYLSRDKYTPKELVGDEYFNELLNKWYFFEEIIRQDNFNCDTVNRYSMDSVVNEFLKSMEKSNLRYADEDLRNPAVAANILHLSFPIVVPEWEAPSWLSNATQLKSLLFLPCATATVGFFQHIDDVLSVLKGLKSLDLAGVSCEQLPHSLGGLAELRYLRLGVSSEYLPESITNLLKLQTLDLRHSSVMVLPRNFYRLVSLKHLYTGDRLMDLPPNFDKLTSLQTLDAFIVGDNNSINALSELNCLVGKLKVRYQKRNTNNVSQTDSEGIFKDKLITDLSLIWSSSYKETDTSDVHQYLQPPQSLKSLALCGWKEVSFPVQLMNTFPILYSLVSLHFEDCNRCQLLPELSALPNLTTLQLWDLKRLQYIETQKSFTATHIFPSLKSLMLANLPELQGWFNENDDGQIFPSLNKLTVCDCPKLMSMPQMPRLEVLETHWINELLLRVILSANKSYDDTGTSRKSTLKSLTIVAVHQLESIPTSWSESSVGNESSAGESSVGNESSLHNLEELIIRNCPHLTELPQSLVELSRLQLLKIYNCSTLNKIPDNFKSLKSPPDIKNCPKLPLGGQQQDDQN